MRRDLALAFALLLAFAQAPAQTPAPRQPAQQQQQQPQPTPTPGQESEEDVVRITSNLVQFDAVVTDKQGRRVADLRPEEFEVYVDGKRQEITNFSFVSDAAGAGRANAPAARVEKSGPSGPVPPVPLRASQVRRTIALVADDLGTSFQDIAGVRRALKKFVDEQMQPGDLVAIMRTSAGIGALQQFTTDKQLLYRAIERVRWSAQGRAGVSTFAPLEPDPLADSRSTAGGKPAGDSKGGGGDDADEDKEKGGASVDEFREGVVTVGVLGTLNFIVRGMKELPGRKSVVVFSGGFKIFRNPKDRNDYRNTDRIMENVRRLTDQANRASVVIYTMDVRGLVWTGLTAADNYSPLAGGQPDFSAVNDRNEELLGNQEGLAYLAEQTGGIFIKNTNDLSGGMQRVLDDQRGYYLIAFRPPEEVFQPSQGKTRFNKFEVNLRRAGLSVRTRAGFYGFAEGTTKPAAPRTRNEQLMAALGSPLSSGELTLRLTSLFNSPAEKAAAVDSLMHIEASQLKLTDEADGWKKAVIDVAAVTFGEDGRPVDEINRTETVRARGEALQLMLSEGLVYMMKVPIKKPGAYQLRVAVRDAQTEKVGSASQFIEVPDLSKGGLALSGVVLTTARDEPAPGAAPQAAADRDPLRDATVRRFRGGSQVDFFYHIYNAKLDPATGRPRLVTQARLLRDGQPVFTGPLVPFDPGPQKEMARLKMGSRLRLGLNLAPGDYVLQVIVTDELAKGSRATATQWLDFEIVK
ncbi:MAG: VWA domain-containing protein [Acidobacteria bacterium]|nr:VWA domain-containing protein [Acidobacteriota bacterium]